MTHRESGRTATRADISVHEPKQPVDNESAMAFTMEGNQQQAPASLRAYTWSPGWNSNQSIHKFQSEVSGSDSTGDPGVLVVTQSTNQTYKDRILHHDPERYSELSEPVATKLTSLSAVTPSGGDILVDGGALSMA